MQDLKLPNWLKLVRVGNTFYALLSADGVNWIQLGATSMAMAGTVYVGTSVASAQHGVWATARFDNLSARADASLPAPVPDPSLPSGWANQDVGAVGPAGDATYDVPTSTFTVTGAGADVWNTADAFHYAHTRLAGDGSIVARVASVSAGAAWVKAGVMLRSSLDPSSAHGFMLVSYAKGTAFQRRTAAAGVSTSTSGGLGTAPFWVRLDRTGNIVDAYQSPDGVAWTKVASDQIPMGSTAYAGLAVSSHTSSATATATFDHVAVKSAAAPGACGSVTLSRTFFYSGAPASNWTVTVTAPTATCTWTATVDQPWILLNGNPGPASVDGTGSTTIRIGTLSNTTGAMRYGQFTIAGMVYKVTQEY
jgi:regulation of enolase protein 1 (concanavalin A-like superfamily)